MTSVSRQSLNVLQQLAALVRDGDIAGFLSEAPRAELVEFFMAHEADIRTISGMCRIITRAVDDEDEQL